MNRIIFNMAVKNLFANKAKLIITLSLIGIGTFLIILGLGILNFAKKQTKDVSESDFSGDILIIGKPDDPQVEVELFGTYVKFAVRTSKPKMPYLLPFEKVRGIVSQTDGVESLTQTVVSGGALVPVDLPDGWKPKNENSGNRPYLDILGNKAREYRTLFTTAQIFEGAYPETDDERYFILPRKTKENYEKYYERSLAIGDEVIVKSSSWSKPKQQRVRITGFFDYAHGDTVIENVAYADADTVRILADMTMGAKTAANIPDSIDLSLSEKSEEDFFASDDAFLVEESVDVQSAKTDFDNLLGSTELRDTLNLPDNEAWHHIEVKLTKGTGIKTAYVIKKLNKRFADENLNVQAVAWNKAMASLSEAIKGTSFLFTVMLVLLSVVVLIVIMNTLVVAVMQRNAEIGTMRAIGAKKSFVRKIFFTESLFMSLTGVCIGIVLALIAAFIINSFDIHLNEVLSYMFGGKKIRVSISVMSIVWTMLAMTAAGLAANWYPVRLALRISPLEAINK